jgi:hypothetical protein
MKAACGLQAAFFMQQCRSGRDTSRLPNTSLLIEFLTAEGTKVCPESYEE